MKLRLSFLSDLKHILQLDNSMHETLSHNVLGYIDTVLKRNDFIEVMGWSLSRTNETKCIRILSNSGETTLLTNIVRPDVCQFYKIDFSVHCGWKETLLCTILPCHLQMEVEPEKWETVFTFPIIKDVSENQFAIQQHPPAYTVHGQFQSAGADRLISVCRARQLGFDNHQANFQCLEKFEPV